MTSDIQIRVPAVPVAQPRPRATSIGGHARVYSPKEHPVTTFKATCALAAKAAYAGPPLEGPLTVSCQFVFPRPKRLIWKKRDMPRLRHTIKPDRDNLDKAVLDALRGILWIDDCQICDGDISKWYAAGDESPHCRITVSKLEN